MIGILSEMLPESRMATWYRTADKPLGRPNFLPGKNSQK